MLQNILSTSIILLGLIQISNAQSIRVSSDTPEHDSYYTRLTLIDIDDCNIDYNDYVSHGRFSGVAYSPEGTLYGFKQSTFEVEESQMMIFNQWLSTSPLTSVFEEDAIEGITCKPNEVIWMIASDQKVYTLNIWSNIVSLVGELPTELPVAGGITYRNGGIYYTTLNNHLVLLDEQNLENSTIVFQFSSDISPINAMTTIHNSCGDIITYASGIEGNISTIYEVDFENETLIEVCEHEPVIWGMTNLLEPVVPPCEVSIDLNPSPILQNYLNDTICVPPQSVTGDFVEVYSELGRVDSLRIWISIGQQNMSEYLSVENLPTSISITGQNTSEIWLTNTTGEANEEDFATAIASLIYHNDSEIILYGTRSIGMRAYSSVYTSSETRAFIPVFNDVLQINPTINSPACTDDLNGNIFLNPFGGVEPYQFTWDNSTTNNSIVNLGVGTYAVTIEDAIGCPQWGEYSLINPQPLATEIINVGEQAVCDTFGILSVAVEGGTSPYTYQWSNGKTEATATGFDDSSHAVTITDAAGCQTLAEYTLASGENIEESISAEICANDTYPFAGQEFSQDTTLCATLTAFNGCDSIVCLDLVVNDTLYNTEAYQLCLGEEYQLEGTIYSTDTTVCHVYESVNNCDSTVCTTLTFQQSVEYLEATICEGEQFNFGDDELTTNGDYQQTLLDSNGCDSIQILSLQVLENPIPEIEQSGSLCAEGESELVISSIYETYQWSTEELSNSITVQESGSFSVTVTDENGCMGSAEYILQENAIQAEVNGISPSCYGLTNGQIEITDFSGGQEPYFVSINDAPLVGETNFTNLAAGTYSILIEDSEGCQYTSTATLIESAPLDLILNQELNIDLGDSILVSLVADSTLPLTASWSPNLGVSCDTCSVSFIRPDETTKYLVQITDENGCTEETSVLVYVNRNINIYAPTAISPNGDGVNDVFYLQSKHDLRFEEFSVFDRWGNQVFYLEQGQTNLSDAGWDGTTNTIANNDGVYVWQVRVIFSDGTSKLISGDVLVF